MNDQLARSLFMDYIYEEIDSKDKRKLETYLENHPHLHKELEELQQTRSLLSRIPEENPNQKLLVLEPNKSSFGQWWSDAKNLLPESFFGKTGFAIAAGLILLLIISSITQLHIDTSGDGIAVSFGYSPTINEGLTEEDAEMLISQIREENAIMMAEYMESMNRQNREQLQQVVNYFQQQRINDLQLVNQTLDELQQDTDYRLQQTNRLWGELLQTVTLNQD